jgi:hypothetical protein
VLYPSTKKEKTKKKTSPPKTRYLILTGKFEKRFVIFGCSVFLGEKLAHLTIVDYCLCSTCPQAMIRIKYCKVGVFEISHYILF